MDPRSGTPAWHHDVVAGRLCLELANTLGGLRGHEAPEHLVTYGDLVAWAVAAGAIGAERGAALRAEAERRPADAARALAEARALREAIHDAVSARVAGRPPRPADLETLNAALSRALARRRLCCDEQRCDASLGWDDDPSALDAPLWPVAASAADLLTSPRDLARVRVCGGAVEGRCGWLFVDETRSGTRRWCSMRDCGNRAKARRHYERTRGRG
jgi:predicted RNA-binding Zn ribbon-like protein